MIQREFSAEAILFLAICFSATESVSIRKSTDLSYTIGHGNNLISNLKATQPLAVNELQFIYIYIYIYNYIYTLHHHKQKEKTRRFPVTKIYEGCLGLIK